MSACWETGLRNPRKRLARGQGSEAACIPGDTEFKTHSGQQGLGVKVYVNLLS